MRLRCFLVLFGLLVLSLYRVLSDCSFVVCFIIILVLPFFCSLSLYIYIYIYPSFPSSFFFFSFSVSSPPPSLSLSLSLSLPPQPDDWTSERVNPQKKTRCTSKLSLMTARVSHKTRNPRKNKVAESSSKVGFGGMLKVGQKVGPEVGFPLYLYMKTYFWTYFLTYFENSPETYF